MARRPRLEVEGGLYHIIARGNDRRDIFLSAGRPPEIPRTLLGAQKGEAAVPPLRLLPDDQPLEQTDLPATVQPSDQARSFPEHRDAGGFLTAAK
jgi:hypothetical protein